MYCYLDNGDLAMKASNDQYYILKECVTEGFVTLEDEPVEDEEILKDLKDRPFVLPKSELKEYIDVGIGKTKLVKITSTDMNTPALFASKGDKSIQIPKAKPKVISSEEETSSSEEETNDEISEATEREEEEEEEEGGSPKKKVRFEPPLDEDTRGMD